MHTAWLLFVETTVVMHHSRILATLRLPAAHIAFILLLGLAGVIADLLPPVGALEQRYALAGLFHWRGTIAASTQVVVIAIDQASMRALGLPAKPDQWPRALHAQLIRQLAQAGASVIVFDLLFDHASTLPQQDAALAAAMRAAGNVVLTESLVQDQVVISAANGQQLGAASIEKTVLPIASLAHAALGTAPFPLPKNMRVDAAWMFKSGTGSTPMLPTLALQIYASDAYASLLRLLQWQDPEFAASLPVDRAAMLHPGAAETLALQLHHYFARYPERGQTLLQAIAGDIAIAPRQRVLLRAVLAMYLGPESRYLNMYGPPRSITTMPYSTVLRDSELPSDAFRGKAIFVGYSAATVDGQDRIRDDYDTVFSQDDGVRLSGVEIGATAFSNALDDHFVQPLDAPARCGLLLIWGAILALLCLTCRVTRAAPVLLLSTGLYLTIAVQLFARHYLWIPLVTPLLLQLPLALFGATLLRYLSAKKDRLYLQHVFSHFIPPSMVEKLASHAPALGTVDPFFYGVCLATDASNYTRLAETMEPVALTNLMNRYYATLFAPVAAHGGIVSDIKGDAMLAIWRDGDPSGTMRTQACRAALALHAAITQAPRTNRAAMLPTRIGLDFGPLTVGNVGAGQHYEYRAVGDTVNTASRIECLNKQLGTWVLASNAVVDGLDGFLCRALGSFLLPGKSIPVDVVEIISERNHFDACDRQIGLCQAFGDALALFQQRRWQQAQAAFTAVLRIAPDDGPAKFYLRECVRKRTADGPGSDDSVIRITDK